MNTRYILLFLVLISCNTFGQNFDFELDYKATYLIENSNKTITIMVGDNGKYLYSDSKELIEKIRPLFKVFGNFNSELESSSQVLMDMSTSFMLLKVKVDENTVWAHANLENIISRGRKIPDGSKIKLVSAPLDEFITINNKEYRLYNVFPEDKPNDILIMAFDTDYKLDYNTYFNKIMSYSTNDNVKIDLPNGILVYVKEKSGKVLLKLLEIENQSYKGEASLKIGLTRNK